MTFQIIFHQPDSPNPLNKLKQQRQYRIDQRSRKDPLCRLIPMRIDVNRKKHDIQQQTRHRDRRDLRLVRPDELQKIPDGKKWIEFHKVIDDKTYERCD